MLWLSSFNGAGEHSSYFDLRDLKIQFRDGFCNANFSGIVGIGSLEFWSEISLGAEQKVELLPVWNEDGAVDQLPDSIDQNALETELVAELKGLLQQLRPGYGKPVRPRWNGRLPGADKMDRPLAA